MEKHQKEESMKIFTQENMRMNPVIELGTYFKEIFKVGKSYRTLLETGLP